MLARRFMLSVMSFAGVAWAWSITPCVVLMAGEPQNDSGSQPRAPVIAPLIQWTFDRSEPGTWRGAAEIVAEGPRPPVFPEFVAENRAARFTGNGAALVVRTSDVPKVDLRFRDRDSLTMECWLAVDELRDGEYRYLVGKGRNKNAAYAAENQNYALRVRGVSGEARPSFLFRSTAGEFHRWTADEGFVAKSGWHHIAVTYTFGKADSLRSWVDGRAVKGQWDLGGKTDRPPVADDDDLVIGTGNGGGAGNSFAGLIDQVAIYREALPDAVLAERYRYIPPVPVVAAGDLLPGRVLVQLCEQGVPPRNAWPTLPATVTEAYAEEAFGLFETPHKYIETGVRADRPNPYVLRAAAKVTLPSGRHRILLRGRSAVRLYVDGEQVLNTRFMKGDDGGHGHVAEQNDYLNLGPEFRFAPPGTLEVVGDWNATAGEHLVVLEAFIGGIVGKSKRRPELGELVVAWAPEGTNDWRLLSPGAEVVRYTDAGWASYVARRRAVLDERNAARRAELRSQNAGYWSRRRELARSWLAGTPEVSVPDLPDGFPANNPIDHFLAVKMAAARAAQPTAQRAEAVDFYRDVRPILAARCVDCHRGGKAQAGLRLDVRGDVLQGVSGGAPVVVAGHPERSTLLERVRSDDADLVMPPKGDRLSAAEIAVLERWVAEGAVWPEFENSTFTVTPLADDLTFLRRVTLDTVGVAPSLAEIDAFVANRASDRRAQVVDRLLEDRRWADHWMGYWQDVLAENPNILNPTLNNTGPFRWWLFESLADNKPFDLFVTELLRMQGSERFGGPAGFGVASQNDAPMAAKGTIVSTAFLGVEMKCARCHDAPAHRSSQRDLFELAAMLGRSAIRVPATSSVATDKLGSGSRKPLISVTLPPGSDVEPRWPFADLCPEDVGTAIAEQPENPRDLLAALITAPQNERFAQVVVNRVWRRFMGRGLVEPVDDWERSPPSHPELLRWLGRQFVRSGYDVKHVARLVLNSHAYQRAMRPELAAPSPLFAAPAPRRLEAEQIVDSLFAATGKPMVLEEVSLDIDGRRDLGNSISLGQPSRSWMLTSTSNERDRPSLNLPRIQAVCDVLAAFGWRGARQDPTSVRETAPNALQPAILSNGTMAVWLTRLSDDHGLTALALEEQPVEQLVERLYLRMLTREPTPAERTQVVRHLSTGYETRRSSRVSEPSRPPRERPKYVSWSNHLDPEATVVRQAEELAARRGEPPTARLTPAWRERLEDVVWSLVNAPELVFTP